MKSLDDFLLITNSDNLQDFIINDLQSFYDDLFLSTFEETKEYSARINAYYAVNSRLFAGLDYTKPQTVAFIINYANYLQRFDFPSSFNSILRLCVKKEIPVGLRLQAASLYLSKDIKYNFEFLDIYDRILEYLDAGFKSEEDNENTIIATFLMYVHKVFNDTYQYDLQVAKSLQTRIVESISEDRFFFLKHSVFKVILELDLDKYDESSSDIIQCSIDDLYRNINLVWDFEHFDLLIEKSSTYADNFKNHTITFNSIFEYATSYIDNLIEDVGSIRNSLGRGTKILDEEKQLFLYIKDYGRMHKAKLDSAFSHLLPFLNIENLDIIDWGCGQALATVVLMDFLKSNKKKPKLHNLILIEPSEICLKRAALHSSNYNYESILTVKNSLDKFKMFSLKGDNTKIHLFSNILDVEDFSIKNLAAEIIENCSGVNYFVCVSPYINISRTARIDAFVEYFEAQTGFEMIEKNQSGKNEWIKTWTKVIRVFKVEIIN